MKPRVGSLSSSVEVTNVSPHGLWLFVDARELFVSFELFPWFRDASIREIGNVTRPSPHHLYWPDLDVDLAVESIHHPERFPRLQSPQRPQDIKGSRKGVKVKRRKVTKRKAARKR
jgi:hypothetical protein